jgi:hypothetical protein
LLQLALQLFLFLFLFRLCCSLFLVHPVFLCIGGVGSNSTQGIELSSLKHPDPLIAMPALKVKGFHARPSFSI